MITINIGAAVLKLDANGEISTIHSATDGELLSESSPLFRVHSDSGLLSPVSMSGTEGRLCFQFPGERQLKVKYEEKPGYAAFCVEAFTGEADNLIVGPVFTVLGEIIGDIVGVSQGKSTAIGIQALNIHTLPGFPENCSPLPQIDTGKMISALSVCGITYFESTAFPTDEGSLLQLYAENRRRTRVRDIMGVEAVTVKPMQPLPDYDGSVEGMSFALFCCDRADALAGIEQIEIGEGLPHPMLDNEWAKTSRKAMASYLITEFGPHNMEKLLSFTQKAGFDSLYHPEPFENWGHFLLRKDQFPEGDSSMAECCRLASEAGIHLGLHTLTSFTTTNDEYVTPVPHERLAGFGESPLGEDIDAETNVLVTEESDIYAIVTTFQAVRIGDEIITYADTERKDSRVVLNGCVRGAFGTHPAPHAKGADVQLLCDYPYKVFFPDIHLQDKYTERLVELFRNTGLCQISYDGLEGCRYTGEDVYALNRFCEQCYTGMENPGLINDASRLHHNQWHMHTRMNWGEPWGCTMREGQTASRIKNQDFYHRNLFPRMLGWFLIRKANRKFEATSIQDLEWALSMAAGFDAGFALSVTEAVLDGLGCIDELLEGVKNWETLRLAGAFPEELRPRLRDPKTEWHLTREEECYLLYPMAFSDGFVCDLLEMQPGQPGGSDWSYENPYAAQPFSFTMRIEGNGEIINPSITTPLGMIKFPCRVKGGQYLIYRDGKAVRTDRNYHVLEEVTPVGKGMMAAGSQHVAFACDFDGEEGPEATVRFITYDVPVQITYAGC